MKSPDVWVIGLGRMGSALHRALRDAGVSHKTRRGRQVAGPRRAGGAAIFFLAVTDVAVSSVAERLPVRAGDVVVHLAGILGPSALDSVKRKGASVGALHPLVAVADRKRPPSLRGGVASLEGDAACVREVRRIARAIGLQVFVFRRVDRAAYHAAAALVATGAVALAQQAARAFARATQPEVDAHQAAAMSRSLLASVAFNVGAVGTDAALASPIVRGDVGAVERHLRALEAVPDAAALYRAALQAVCDVLEEQGKIEAAILRRVRAL